MISDNFTLIIRSANERTVSLCEKLILEQGVNKENVFIVCETPFSAALKKSFEIGIFRKLPWTFCVDADVLLRPGSVEYMIKIASRQKVNMCEIQGMMVDKFFCGPRPGGIHLYRTSLLPQALKMIPEEGIDIRPEFHTLQKMRDDGYPFVKVPYIVGIHDFEQYNYDIYRKCFIHGIKHLKHAEMLISAWKVYANEDADFKIALRAFTDSIIHNNGSAYINSKHDLYLKLFKQTGIKEKEALDPSAYTSDNIEFIINNWKEPEAYLKKFPTRWGLDNPAAYEKVTKMIKEKGILRTFILITGKIISDIGNKIMKLSKSVL